MIFKNLLRRKTRTLLTVLGISIGVATIIALGAMANGLESGYGSMLSGSRSDLILSQPNTYDISFSTVDETVGPEVLAMPEVAEISSMLQGIVQTDKSPYFFIFGYPTDSFALNRFQIIDGVSINDKESSRLQGKPLMLGSAAAESLGKKAGDTIRMTNSIFRISGIYQTGDAFEDSGAIITLEDAQELLGRPRQVSLYYIKLKDPSLRERLQTRVERQWKNLSLSNTKDFTNQQSMGDALKVSVWVIAGLAIVLGGVGMMNAQLMAVFERTREIGVLRAVGWRRSQILWMILGESVIVCLIGGVVGCLIGWLMLVSISNAAILFGTTTASISLGSILQAFIVVFTLGLVGGLYPAKRAADLRPIEALRYEGGTSGEQTHRLPFGGMALQSLWQRSTRTLLTLIVITLTVTAIMALDGIVQGLADSLTSMAFDSDSQIMLRQADVSDTSLSAIDERIGERIAAMPEVKAVSGMVLTAIVMPETSGFFIIQGYSPADYAIRRFNIVDGNSLTSNRQIIIGRAISESLKKAVGDTLVLGGSRFKIVGIFETGIGWEELGGVITLRDSQTFTGRPRKVTMYVVQVNDPKQASEIVTQINQRFPEVYAALSGDFVEQMPDMQASANMTAAISFLAIIVGGLGVMNTMLMAVMERTREIGVLRAVGWQRRKILGLIFRESLTLASIGGLCGMILGPALTYLLSIMPAAAGMITPVWEPWIFIRAFSVALALGAIGGLYPAYRATKLRPIEALHYE